MPDDLEEERRALARTLVSLRFPIDNPAFDISASLDEPVEKITLAEFYNGPAATWVRMNSRWEWSPVQHSDFNAVSTVRDLGKLCFAHLALKPPTVTTVTEDAL
jgi:hypothetical protein